MELLKSDGSTAKYYELPKDATELYHLIIHKNMNGQIAEIFRACYRYGEVEYSSELRDVRKMRAYADQEIERLENIELQEKWTEHQERKEGFKNELVSKPWDDPSKTKEEIAFYNQCQPDWGS